jgi:hypothetical protein
MPDIILLPLMSLGITILSVLVLAVLAQLLAW